MKSPKLIDDNATTNCYGGMGLYIILNISDLKDFSKKFKDRIKHKQLYQELEAERII